MPNHDHSSPVSTLRCACLALAFIIPGVALAEPANEVKPGDMSSTRAYSPYAYRNFPDQVFFGDMHIHSNLSPDAGLLGTSLSASDVYRAARGETVTSNTGQPFRLVRPLDFLVLTDHAEAMGLASMIRKFIPFSSPQSGGVRYGRASTGARKAR